MEEIEFEVGEKYENMKGIFEVIAIRRDSMDIRWEDGEEISTPIDLQQRILKRMQHEKELEAEKIAKKAKKAKAAAARGGKPFTGLQENDFSDTVSKTKWRGRGQIGGAVAHQIKSKQFKFNSWAVLRKPEVRWLDVKRQKQENLSLQVKFYTRVEADSLCFGIHIPTADPSDSGKTDWIALQKWLDRPENNARLLERFASHGLFLFDLGRKGFSGTLEADKDQWMHRSEKSETPVTSLNGFLSGIDNPGKMDLRIEKRMAKEDAIEKKQSVADDIARLFEILLPVYTAAAT